MTELAAPPTTTERTASHPADDPGDAAVGAGISAAAPISAAARRGLEFLARNGERGPDEAFGVRAGALAVDDAVATLLMDVFRRTGSEQAFELLVDLATPGLQRRAHSRVRFTDRYLDPHEVVQDTFVNIYRYPEKFDGARPGAFRAWSSMILDNAARRQLRRARSGVDLQLRPIEVLSSMPDADGRQPGTRVQDAEDCGRLASAFSLVLACYLDAYAGLTERERYVLQMVEIHEVRYAPLAEQLGIRPEALKMVVFRARRRIMDRIAERLANGDVSTAAAA